MTERRSNAGPLIIVNPQYYSVDKEYLSEISFFICNDDGQELRFGSSPTDIATAVVLHFRKV